MRHLERFAIGQDHPRVVVIIFVVPAAGGGRRLVAGWGVERVPISVHRFEKSLESRRVSLRIVPGRSQERAEEDSVSPHEFWLSVRDGVRVQSTIGKQKGGLD